MMHVIKAYDDFRVQEVGVVLVEFDERGRSSALIASLN